MAPLTRRQFLRVSALTAAGTVVAACGGQPASPTPLPVAQNTPVAVLPTSAPAQPTAAPVVPPTAVPAAPAEPAARYSEAPMLAEKVAAGELPPVDERLPLNPCILTGMEGVGKYGGTLRRGFMGPADNLAIGKLNGATFAWFTPELALRPDIAESWTVNEDGSEYTILLREGMRWSDGEPFGSKDVMWWYEHQILNPDLTKSKPKNWCTGAGDARTLATITAPDEYTVVIAFADPNPLWVYRLSVETPFTPGHYMQQFHADYADKAALEAAAKEAGLTTWTDIFGQKNNQYLNIERPSVNPWVSVTAASEELYLLDRNPYFWQVDEEGQQLPYIDRFQNRIFESKDVFKMWIINGEIDFQARHVDLPDYTLLKESEAQGAFQVRAAGNDQTNVIILNQTVLNEPLAEFFSNRNVRIALSHAIDRQEIVDLVYDGILAEPKQYSPSRTSPFWDEALAKAYTEYDPEKANAMLDAEGYDQRDAEGYRMYKDGSDTIFFTMEDDGWGIPDEMEMVVSYFDAVGIKCQYKVFERALVDQRCNSNALEVRYNFMSRAVLPLVEPEFFIGSEAQKPFGCAWSIYYNNPSDPLAIEPPDGHYQKRIWEIWETIRLEPDPDRQVALFQQILDIHREELPVLGTVGELKSPMVMKDGLKGIPPAFTIPYSNTTRHDGFVPVQTFYWEDTASH